MDSHKNNQIIQSTESDGHFVGRRFYVEIKLSFPDQSTNCYQIYLKKIF